jgi:hypothetical protein
MFSAFCVRGKDRTQCLLACCSTLYPLSYPACHLMQDLLMNQAIYGKNCTNYLPFNAGSFNEPSKWEKLHKLEMHFLQDK